MRKAAPNDKSCADMRSDRVWRGGTHFVESSERDDSLVTTKSAFSEWAIKTLRECVLLRAWAPETVLPINCSTVSTKVPVHHK